MLTHLKSLNTYSSDGNSRYSRTTKNLIYIDSETSQKVKRWKLSIQIFDCDVGHVAGKLNSVADGFSRLFPEGGLPNHIEREQVFWVREDYYTGTREVKSRIALESHVFAEEINWTKEFSIPKDKEEIIAKFHNSVVGHHGVEGTLKNIKEKILDAVM